MLDCYSLVLSDFLDVQCYVSNNKSLLVGFVLFENHPYNDESDVPEIVNVNSGMFSCEAFSSNSGWR